MASEAMKELLQNHVKAQGERRLREIETGAEMSALNAQLIWVNAQEKPKEVIQEATAKIVNKLFGTEPHV